MSIVSRKSNRVNWSSGKMNLTLIKNFFLSDRKSIEPTKVGRVLRRSFRVKRSKQVLDSIRSKRKSGNFNSPLSLSRAWIIFAKNSDAIIGDDLTTLTTSRMNHPKLTSLSLSPDRFICQQSRMDHISSRARPATRHRWIVELGKVGAGPPISDRELHARRVSRRRSVQERNSNWQPKLFVADTRWRRRTRNAG